MLCNIYYIFIGAFDAILLKTPVFYLEFLTPYYYSVLPNVSSLDKTICRYIEPIIIMARQQDKILFLSILVQNDWMHKIKHIFILFFLLQL